MTILPLTARRRGGRIICYAALAFAAIAALLLLAQANGALTAEGPSSKKEAIRTAARPDGMARPSHSDRASRFYAPQKVTGDTVLAAPFASKLDEAGEFTPAFLASEGEGLPRVTADDARAQAGFPILLPDPASSASEQLLGIRYPDEDGRRRFAFFYRRGLELHVRAVPFSVDDEVDRLLELKDVADDSDPQAQPAKILTESRVRGRRAAGRGPVNIKRRAYGAVTLPSVLVFAGPGSNSQPNVMYKLVGQAVPVAELISIAEGLR